MMQQSKSIFFNKTS